MSFLFDFVQNAGLFVILFGILVFIHELGHFSVAKWTGVGVEKFFLGFGPKIFSFRKGETEYGVNWIPLGGYVKLLGEDPSDRKNISQDGKAFMSKSPLQRIAVVSAGPISNLVLPIILFAFLFMVGVPTLGPVIGEVIKDSPAEMTGLLQGDEILEINGENVKKWDDLTKIIRNSDGSEILFKIKRYGEIVDLKVKPRRSKVQNIFREVIDGWTVGITPYQNEPAIGLTDTKSNAYRAGLRNGDVIKEIDGKEIEYFWQFEDFLENHASRSFIITVERTENKLSKSLSFKLGWKTSSYNSPTDVGIYRSDLFIASVKPESIAGQKGIKKGDMIVSVDGKEATGWMDLEKAIKDNKGEPIEIGLIRNGRPLNVNITPELISTKDQITGADEKRRELGIEPLVVTKSPPVRQIIEKTYNPIKALYLGTAKTYMIFKTQSVGFVKLIRGDLSIKHIGGPILIYKLAGRSFEMGGIFSFISYIALLSIVLGFVNLLPIPIMDGGHILFYSIEIVKRSPLSLRTREIAQQVGFVIIIGLMLLATYNDIKRYFFSGIAEFFKKMF